jgi:hypothetical protein
MQIFQKIFIYSLLGLFLSSCQNEEEKLSKIKAIVQKWNLAHNEKDYSTFEEIYANNVSFYQSQFSNKEAVDAKRKLFISKPTFFQTVDGNIDVSTLTNGNTKCIFLKKVTLNRKTEDYPSYLILDKDHKIIEESDLETDKILKENVQEQVTKQASKVELTSKPSEIETNLGISKSDNSPALQAATLPVVKRAFVNGSNDLMVELQDGEEINFSNGADLISYAIDKEKGRLACLLSKTKTEKKFLKTKTHTQTMLIYFDLATKQSEKIVINGQLSPSISISGLSSNTHIDIVEMEVFFSPTADLIYIHNATYATEYEILSYNIKNKSLSSVRSGSLVKVRRNGDLEVSVSDVVDDQGRHLFLILTDSKGKLIRKLKDLN